ncbi:hypothetical protein [Metabacillus sp. RGM 3146]|uniref:hypothetical protein n=1 Tax=Metabacillus sp. RGM 3146 TaxID=3401092 RepID=UPI003B99DA6C
MEENNNMQAAKNLGDSLFNSWANSLNRIYASQKEVESLTVQAFGRQKESLVKISEDMSRIEQEQKKLVEELREVGKKNIQTVYGEEASQFFEQWNEHFDEVTNRIQQLTVTPYKEGLNTLNDSQEYFQESIKKGIEQQQKVREDFLNLMKTTQKGFFDLVGSSTKMSF